MAPRLRRPGRDGGRRRDTTEHPQGCQHATGAHATGAPERAGGYARAAVDQANGQARGLSLRALVGGGFTIVALGLAVALGYTVIALQSLGDQSERLLTSGVATTRLIEQLADRINEVERTARQYAVVGSPDLQQIYRDRRAALLDTMVALESREDVPTLVPALQQLRVLLDRIEALLSHTPAAVQDPSSFTTMNQISQRTRDVAQARFDSEVAILRRNIQQMRRALMALAGAVAAAAVLAALAFAWLINRPMRQITASIGSLGRAELDQPIRVSGPRDLQAIGVSLDWLRQRIRDLEAQKSTFVRHMSHELKSPLANIRAGIDLLKDDAAGDLDKQEIAAIVERNAARLQRQIDDLLQYAGWQDAQPPQLPGPVRLQELIEKSMADQRPEARSRNIQLRAELEALTVTGDEGQIRSIVDNLIGNAIKYSPNDSGIDVRLSRWGDAAHIDVEDQGPGIPEPLRERVFEPFFRGPEATTTAGTGIGLSLAAAAARAHGGSIRIIDKRNGAHFQAELPLVKNV